MFETLLTGAASLLGGGAFRTFIGVATDYLGKAQAHKHEVELLKLSEVNAASAAVREIAQIQMQADLGAKQISLVGEVEHEKRLLDVDEKGAEAFSTAQVGFARSVGIPWVDALNASMRFTFFYVALVLWVCNELGLRTLSENGWVVVGSVFGFVLADRHLLKSGK